MGDPETIPYSFQYQLDVQYAVGRIYFDTLDEYAQYAQSVVTAEKNNPRPARLTLFGTRNPDDAATAMSMQSLIRPLAEQLPNRKGVRDGAQPWDIQVVQPENATKADLASILNGGQTPSLLFTASHGIGFPNGDSRQLPHQGALVCQDWPGPEAWQKTVPQDFYLAGDDITEDARLLGLIAFHFACYSAGTPRLDDYPQRTNQAKYAMAPLGLPRDCPSPRTRLSRASPSASLGIRRAARWL